MPTDEANVKFLYLLLTNSGQPQVDWTPVCAELGLNKAAATKRWSRLKASIDKGEVPAGSIQSAYDLLWLLVKHRTNAPSANDWKAIAKECDTTAGAASKRYSRMKLAFEKERGTKAPTTPKKGTQGDSASETPAPDTPTPARKRAPAAKRASKAKAKKQEADDDDVDADGSEDEEFAAATAAAATKKRKRAPVTRKKAMPKIKEVAEEDHANDGTGDNDVPVSKKAKKAPAVKITRKAPAGQKVKDLPRDPFHNVKDCRHSDEGDAPVGYEGDGEGEAGFPYGYGVGGGVNIDEYDEEEDYAVQTQNFQTWEERERVNDWLDDMNL